MFARWCPWALVGALTITLVAPGISADSKKDKKKVVPVTKLDTSAEHIDVFEGIEKGMLDVKMIPKDALGGNLLVENKTDKPLNVDFPEAFIGRQILKQFGGGGGFGGGGMGGGGMGGMGGGGMGGGAQTQGGGMGGGMGGMGGGMGGMGGGMGGMGGGGGFFSVPTDKIIRVSYRSVCLEHGKPDPSPRMTYQIGKVEEFSDDPVLGEVLKMVGRGQLDSQSAQAAAWHLTDKMSWTQLDAKATPHIGRPATKYFSAEQLRRAQHIVATAAARAKDSQTDSPKSTTVAAKSNRSTSATIKRDAN